jgi:stage III sporulation protein SpoIIIAA
LCLGNLLEMSKQCIQMVYLESPQGIQRVSSTSLQCMQMAYIESCGLHRVSISRKTMIEDNQIKAKGTIFMSCCYD